MAKILIETNNYAVVTVNDMNEGKDDWKQVLSSSMDSMERLLADGYRPLHYLPRFSGWVCEKQKPALKRVS